MALINNIYVFVEEESIDYDVTTTSHPTEKGLPISDTIRKNPIVLSLQGKIVDTDKVKAETAVKKIKELQNSGSLITYIGQAGTIKNLQIQSFSTSYTNKNYGGADYNMTLQEIRTAKSAYIKPKTSNMKNSVKDTPKLTLGRKVSFKGGNVYVSSDAKKPASKRGSSTVEITKISSASYSIHKYHVKSVDGRYVYGWVDESTLAAISNKTNQSSSGGTQQTSRSNSETYYTVKNGDTLYTLINTKFRSMNLSATEVVKNNPKSFKGGKPSQLIAGTRLVLD